MRNQTYNFGNGTRLELCEGSGYGAHCTVFVSENGWRTTYWWSTFEMAKASFDSCVGLYQERKNDSSDSQAQ